MKIKEILSGLLVFVLLTANCTFAANWVPVKADNGKIAEIDIDSIEKSGNLIKYKIKQILENEVIYSMVTNSKNKTTAIINMAIYKNNKQIGFEDYSKTINYSQIKKGSLNETVYKILTLTNDTATSGVEPSTWKKYFNKQQKKIQRNWHPNLMLSGGDEPTEKSIAYVMLVLNKNGNIIKKSYLNNTNKDTKYKKFNDRLQEEIEKPFKKIEFDPLPEEYKEDKLIIIMKFEYSKTGNVKSKTISFNNTGIGYLECAKKESTLIDLALILGFPLIILCYIISSLFNQIILV